MRPRTPSALRSMTEQRAVIDIGSNTVRLVIYGGPMRAPSVLLNEKITARLGKGVAETGHLTEKAAGVTLAALARFALVLQMRGVTEVKTVATAAVRDAANGTDFLSSVRALGLDPRLLSGVEEAVASANGVLGAFPGAQGVVADLGGGSLELVHVAAGQCHHGTSLPFGTLRLPHLRAAGPAVFARGIRKAIDDAAWHCAEGEALYLVGGSHRALARYAMHQLNWPLDDPHGFEIMPEAALSLSRAVLRGKLPADVPGLAASRLASLPDTAALLAALVREVRPERLVFSAWGLREGLIQMGLSPAERAQDPLVAGVSAFTEALGCPSAIAAMVAGWTTAANPADGESNESLRLAATMLALAAHRVEPNLRAELVADWALRKRWIGADTRGRAMMATCALASSGRLAALPDLSAVISPASQREAVLWGLAIRLCRRFSSGSAQALSNSSLFVEGPQLVLAVREPYPALVTDPVEKDLRQLAERLGLQPSFRRAV